MGPPTFEAFEEVDGDVQAARDGRRIDAEFADALRAAFEDVLSRFQSQQAKEGGTNG